VDRTDDDKLWNGSEEDMNVRSVRQMKALTIQMERVTLTDKGRHTLICSVYYVHEIVKYFFLAGVLFEWSS
jgi:hypothetical protein